MQAQDQGTTARGDGMKPKRNNNRRRNKKTNPEAQAPPSASTWAKKRRSTSPEGPAFERDGKPTKKRNNRRRNKKPLGTDTSSVPMNVDDPPAQDQPLDIAPRQAAPAVKTKTHLSTTSFASLSSVRPEIKRALVEKFKCEFLSKIQLETLELLLDGQDVIAQAPTGTGKTIAFLLPVLQNVLRLPAQPNAREIQALVLSPTRELALQIYQQAKNLVSFLPQVKLGCYIGGRNMSSDVNEVKRVGPNVVIATPGRFLDHLKQKTWTSLSGVSMVVLDEADRLVDPGFLPDIKTILMRCSLSTRQTILFSATFPTKEFNFPGCFAPSAKQAVLCSAEAQPTQKVKALITQEGICCDSVGETLDQLVELLRRHQEAQADSPYYSKMMVFCATAKMAAFMSECISTLYFPHWTVLEIHSRKSQSSRMKTSSIFQQLFQKTSRHQDISKQHQLMFTSDVSARGVDYPYVSLVVQLGMPSSAEQYLHRIGRTGRNGSSGHAVILLSDFESKWKTHVAVKAKLPIAWTHAKPIASDSKWTSMSSQHQQALDSAYTAFLGFYKAQAKVLGLSPGNIMYHANAFYHYCGFATPPKLEKKLLRKLGFPLNVQASL